MPYGPAAPPRSDLVVQLQHRMVQLGFSVSSAGSYGEAEDTVVRSYAAQLGLTSDDLLDLNTVIGQVLPVMDADIQVKGLWQPPPPGTLVSNPVDISGAGGAGWGLALLGVVGVWWLLTSKA